MAQMLVKSFEADIGTVFEGVSKRPRSNSRGPSQSQEFLSESQEASQLDGSTNADPKGKTFGTLLSLSKNELHTILASAYALLGQEIPTSQYQALDSKGPSMFLMREPPNGYQVIVYRPLALTGLPPPHTLRFLYHRLAERMRPVLLSFLEGLGNALSNTKILLIGLGEAGLAACNHATYLIFQHPSISAAGKLRNLNNQISVITVASPHAISAETLLQYRLARENFFAFAPADAEEEIDSAGYRSLGYYSRVNTGKPDHKSIRVPNDIVALSKIYVKQDIKELDSHNIFQKLDPAVFSTDDATRIRAYFSFQEGRIYGTIMGALDAYNVFIQAAENEDYVLCAMSLQARVQNALLKRLERSDEFCKRYRPGELSWALREPVECKYQPQDKQIICYYMEGDHRRVIAVYQVKLPGRDATPPPSAEQSDLSKSQLFDLDESQSRPSPSSPSIPQVAISSASGSIDGSMAQLLQETMLFEDDGAPPPPSPQRGEHLPEGVRAEALDACLEALFNLQKDIQLLSPYNPQKSTMDLLYYPWLDEIRRCEVEISPGDNALHRLHDTAPRSLLALTTSPALVNPKQCRPVLPPTIPTADLKHAYQYWEKFMRFLKDYSNSKIFSITSVFASPKLVKDYGQDKVVSQLFDLIAANIEADPARFQFDCRDRQNLWHGQDFCPTICQHFVLGRASEICSRMHISKSGLKISLRKGPDVLNMLTDPTGSEIATLKNLPLFYSNRHTMILVLNHCEEKLDYYLTVFLEGPMYARYRKLLSPSR